MAPHKGSSHAGAGVLQGPRGVVRRCGGQEPEEAGRYLFVVALQVGRDERLVAREDVLERLERVGGHLEVGHLHLLEVLAKQRALQHHPAPNQAAHVHERQEVAQNRALSTVHQQQNSGSDACHTDLNMADRVAL